MPEEEKTDKKGFDRFAKGMQAVENAKRVTSAFTSGRILNLMTPEGVIMMGLAITLDLVGLIINLCALDDLGMLDIVGIVIICGWMLFRSRGKQVTASAKAQQQAQKWITKLFQGKWSKFLTPIIGEVIPYVGALPCWTLAVFFEITENDISGIEIEEEETEREESFEYG